MIKGDIDLTENLDFYHDKEKKIQGTNIVPWKDKNEKITSEVEFISNGYLPVTSYTTDVYYTNSVDGYLGSFRYDLSSNTMSILSSPSPRVVTSVNISNDQILSWTETETDRLTGENYSITYYNVESTYPTITTNWADNIMYDISTNNGFRWNSNYIEKSRSKSEYFNIFKEKPKKDNSISLNRNYNCCGHKTLGPCKCNKHCKDSRRIFIIMENLENEYEDIKDNHAYDIRVRLSNDRSEKKKEKRSYMGKDRKIPWLDKLNYRVYNDYMRDLYEDYDYSSYLTNMDWLGIR